MKLNNALKAEFKEHLLVLRYPLRTRKISLFHIKGFYAYPYMAQKQLLIISYRAGRKTKRMKIVVDEWALEPFLTKLKQVAPGLADLLDKNKADALRLLGTTDTRIRTILIATAICMVTISFLFLPTIWHCIFDSHLATTTIEDLYAGKLPGSGYITFSARLGKNGLVTSGRNIRNSVRTQRVYFPIFPEQWQPGDPVKAVLMIDNNPRLLKEFNAHKGEKIQVTGVIRNVLWETIFPGGLTDILSFSGEIFSSWQERLSTRINSPVNEPLLIEYQIDPKKQTIHDMWIFAIVLLIPTTSIIFSIKDLKTK